MNLQAGPLELGPWVLRDLASKAISTLIGVQHVYIGIGIATSCGTRVANSHDPLSNIVALYITHSFEGSS